MQLNRFDGGINQRLAPHLLNSNEAVELTNINPVSGCLEPYNEAIKIKDKAGESCCRFKGSWVFTDKKSHFAEFNDLLFKSDGFDKCKFTKDGVNWVNINPDKPTNEPAVSPFITGNFELEPVIIPKVEVTAFSSNPYAFGFGPITTPAWAEAEDGLRKFLPEGYLYYKVKVKHKDLPLWTSFSGEFDYLCRVVPREDYIYDRTKIRISIILGQAWYPFNSENLKLFVSQDSSENRVYRLVGRADICDDYDNCSPYHALSSNLGKEYTEDEFDKFLSGKECLYTIVWTRNNKQKEIFQRPFKFEYENSVCYGVRVKKRNGFTLTLYRDGKKCDLIEDGDYYYDNKPTLEEELKTEDIYYLYTYYNSKLNIETPPSPTKAYASIKDTLVYVVSWDIPTDPAIDKVRLYRFGRELSLPSLVATIDASIGHYTDNLNNPIDGRVLTTTNNVTLPEGISSITASNGMLFAYKNKTIYFSNIGKPFEWSEFNTLQIEDDVTGIGSTPNGICIFTKYKSYILTGNSPANFSKFILSSTTGCVHNFSVQTYKNILIWLGVDGIYFTNGGDVINITKSKFREFKISDVQNSVIWDDKYLLTHNKGTLMIDLLTQSVFNLTDRVVSFAVKDNDLYHLDFNGDFFKTFGGNTPRKITFKSAKFAEGSLTNRKTYSNLYFHSTGNLHVKVYIDSQLAGEVDLQQGTTELKLSSLKTNGYNLTFEVEGSGNLTEIEYKAEGRQNGR